MASPQIKARDQKPPAKTVEFVIDRSGSMSGKKIEQVRKALKFVLENLHEGDLFNIIAYDSEVEAFRPELEKFNEKTRKAALGFVEGIYAGGATNIDGAMKTALGQLKDSSRPNYIVFLTDGIPTTGVTNEPEILKNVKDENQVHARLFTFGVGYDVNSRLLDKMARENHGRSEYVRPNEDIEDRVSRLYQSIESPVMTGVQLEFLFDEAKTEEGSLIDRVYPKDSLDLFSGEQLVVVGRYKKPGTVKVVLKGSVDGSQQKLDFPAELTAKSGDESCAFIEKLWAVRRVGEIIDELDLKGKNEELIKELVDLAKKHGILTPYTSFFADDNVNLHDVTANEFRADRRLRALEQVDGQSGVAQRQYKAALQQAGQQGAPAGGVGGMPAQALRLSGQWAPFRREQARGKPIGVGSRRGSGCGFVRGGCLPVCRSGGGQGGGKGRRDDPHRRQPRLLSPQRPVDRLHAKGRPAAKGDPRQAVQPPVLRPGQALRQASDPVPGLRRAGDHQRRFPGLPDRAVTYCFTGP